jgi:hypothetical protein
MSGVTLYYAGKPIPKGWRIWGPKCRPDPDRLFFELRFHHTGVWKMTLDYRPVDGAFPEMWQPPLFWKYALELEAVAELLKQPTAEWCKQLVNVHPGNAVALEGAMSAYAELWKNKKKLLFGTAEGHGMQDFDIKALESDEVNWDQEGVSNDLKNLLVMSLTGSAHKLAKKVETAPSLKPWPQEQDEELLYEVLKPFSWGKELYEKDSIFSLEHAKKHGFAFQLAFDENDLGSAIPKYTHPAYDKNWPLDYETVLIDLTKEKKAPQVNLPVKVEIEGAEWLIDHQVWQFILKATMIGPGGVPAFMMGMIQDNSTESKEKIGPPVVKCAGVYIEQMNEKIIELGFSLLVGESELVWHGTFTVDSAPSLFPPHGKITKGNAYYVPNPMISKT